MIKLYGGAGLSMTTLQGLDRDLAQLQVKLRRMIDESPNGGLSRVLDNFEREAESIRGRASRDEKAYVSALIRWMLEREGLLPPQPIPHKLDAHATVVEPPT